MPKIQQTAKAAISASDAAKKVGSKQIFVLMDESGSMQGLEEAVTTGCNEFIHEFVEDPDAQIWLAWFDQSPGETRTRLKIKGEPAREVKPLMPADYSPRGLTPLNDAIADCVSLLDMAASDDEIVFFAIITDGMENASETSTASTKSLLTAREEAGWGIVFVGANQNANATAADFGMAKPGRAFNFRADEEGVKATMHGVAYLATSRGRAGKGRDGLAMYDEIASELHTKKRGNIDSKDD